MNRDRIKSCPGRRRVPRTRGDEPPWLIVQTLDQWCSPHLCVPRTRGDRMVFPDERVMRGRIGRRALTWSERGVDDRLGARRFGRAEGARRAPCLQSIVRQGHLTISNPRSRPRMGVRRIRRSRILFRSRFVRGPRLIVQHHIEKRLTHPRPLFPLYPTVLDRRPCLHGRDQISSPQLRVPIAPPTFSSFKLL